MVYITGDCHSNWKRFSSDRFPEQRELTRDDFIIVCGDFGLWHDDKTERWWLDWMEEKNFTILFVDGNHENFDRLYGDEFEVVDFHGGKAHKIRENVYHLMRGYVFDLCGKKFFAFGGASSHDIEDGILDRDDFISDDEFNDTVRAWYRQNKWFRINHISWWEQEMPSQEEMNFGLRTLEQNGNKVDFIVSHCCPQEVASVFLPDKPNQLASYFDVVSNTVEFSKWFFGHYHNNTQVFSKFIMLYEQIVRIV